LVAIGLINFLEKYKKIGIVILVGLIVWSVGRIYLSVFRFNDYFRGQYWETGIEEMINKIKDEKIPVVIDNGRGEIYSQILFFTKADPIKYQENNFEVSESNYYTDMTRNKTKKIGNIMIKGIVWKNEIAKEQILVGDNLAISDEQIKQHCLTKMFEIRGLDNKLLFIGVKTNPQLEKNKKGKGCF
jgi:hypothetical protein